MTLIQLPDFGSWSPDRRDGSAGVHPSGDRPGDQIEDSLAEGSGQSQIYPRVPNRGAMTATLGRGGRLAPVTMASHSSNPFN